MRRGKRRRDRVSDRDRGKKRHRDNRGKNRTERDSATGEEGGGVEDR